jgi:hypothetical protein
MIIIQIIGCGKIEHIAYVYRGLIPYFKYLNTTYKT